jgi:GNAT superfamily N-acetyltransferase
MRVREATPDDAQTVKQELLAPGFREAAAVDPEFAELDEDGVADAGIDRWLDDEDSALDGDESATEASGDAASRVLFVAETDGGELAAYISGGRHDSPPIYARGPYANVDGLYVKPEHRREGLASRLFDRFEAWAADRGCEHVGVSAHVDNAAAVEMYDERFERKYVSYRGRLDHEAARHRDE